MLLSVLDKLVIGLIATLLVSCWQSHRQAEQKLRDLARAEAQVYTEYLREQRSTSLTLMDKYFDRVRDIIPFTAGQEQAAVLEALREELALVFYVAAAVAPSLEGQTRPLLNAMENLNEELSQQNPSAEALLDQVRKRYAQVLNAWREASVTALRTDIYAIDEGEQP